MFNNINKDISRNHTHTHRRTLIAISVSAHFAVAFSGFTALVTPCRVFPARHGRQHESGICLHQSSQSIGI